MLARGEEMCHGRRRQRRPWCHLGVLLGVTAVVGKEGPPQEAASRLHLVDVPLLVCDRHPAATLQLEAKLDPATGENSTTPQVLTFYRTSLASVAVTFSLRSASGEEVMKNRTVTLSDLRRPRRLHAQEDAPLVSYNCEEFFLFDGRDPVDLPDTWAEARSAFTGICEEEGVERDLCAEAEEAAFGDAPADEAYFMADSEFCQQLAETGLHYWGSGVSPDSGLPLPRRLKAGGGVGGGGGRAYGGRAGAGPYGTAGQQMSTRRHPRWVSRTYPALGAFGFGAAFLAFSYPRGYFTTPYGYTGRGGGAASQEHGAGGQDGSMHAISSYVSFDVEKSKYSRRITHCYDRSNQTCIDGQVASTSDGSTIWRFETEDELARDDLMTFGFIAQADQSPYELTVSAVVGGDYAGSRICSPPGWDLNTTWWRPPPREDLFVTLTKVKRLPPGEEEEDLTAIFLGGGAILCGICSLVMCCQSKACRDEDDWAVQTTHHSKADHQDWARTIRHHKVPAQCVPPMELDGSPGRTKGFY